MDESLRSRLAAIQRCRPDLARDIEQILNDPALHHDEDEIEIFPSSRGPETLRIAGRAIHSRFDPLKEAEKRVARLLTEEDTELFILVGLGLGYLCDAFSRRGAVQTVAIVFSAPLLTRLLTLRSVDWWCSTAPQRLIPATLPGVIPVVLRDLTVTNPRLVPSDAYGTRWPDQYGRAVDTIRAARERATVNRRTLRRFGKLWVRNTIRNIAISGALPGIDPYRSIADGVPALVCGAGPTLDEIEPHIRDLARRHIVIAVDTAVSVLQRWGIAPHIAVVADPQYWNTRHLDRVDLETTVLVAEPATHPRTLRLWRGPILVSASLFPLGSFFDRRFNRQLKLGAGGSVATSAWDLARILGATDIALAGIDLAFPDNLTHCADSFFENRLQRVATRLSPAEHGLARYLHGAEPGYVPAAGGGTVLSDRRMEVYRSWFAEQVYRFPDVTTVLLSRRSSAIPGVAVEAPEQRVRRLPVISDTLAAVVDRIQTPPTVGAMPTAREVLSELSEELEALEAIAREGIETCDVLSPDDPSSLTALDEVDRRLGAAEFRELAGFLAAEVLETEAHSAPDDIAGAIAKARRIYVSLAESSEYHLSCIHFLQDIGHDDRQ